MLTRLASVCTLASLEGLILTIIVFAVSGYALLLWQSPVTNRTTTLDAVKLFKKRARVSHHAVNNMLRDQEGVFVRIKGECVRAMLVHFVLHAI